MMKVIRFVLGNLILFLDFLFTPKGLVRPESEQEKVDLETNSLVLYELKMCPFCVKVRREIKRLSLLIERRDISDSKNHAELMAGGKIDQVPCLKITEKDGSVRFLYESDEINQYLRNRFQAIVF